MKCKQNVHAVDSLNVDKGIWPLRAFTSSVLPRDSTLIKQCLFLFGVYREFETYHVEQCFHPLPTVWSFFLRIRIINGVLFTRTERLQKKYTICRSIFIKLGKVGLRAYFEKLFDFVAASRIANFLCWEGMDGRGTDGWIILHFEMEGQNSGLPDVFFFSRS